MSKYIVIIILLIVAALIAYLTFVIAAIKITIGVILLGISAISLLLVWILWKVKNE